MDFEYFCCTCLRNCLPALFYINCAALARNGERSRAPQPEPKITLGVLLLRTLGIKIGRLVLVLIFNLVLVLHASLPPPPPPPLPPKKNNNNKIKRFIITHFETSFLLLSKYLLSLSGTLEMFNVFFFMTSLCERFYSVNLTFSQKFDSRDK